MLSSKKLFTCLVVLLLSGNVFGQDMALNVYLLEILAQPLCGDDDSMQIRTVHIPVSDREEIPFNDTIVTSTVLVYGTTKKYSFIVLVYSTKKELKRKYSDHRKIVKRHSSVLHTILSPTANNKSNDYLLYWDCMQLSDVLEKEQLVLHTDGYRTLTIESGVVVAVTYSK